MVGRKADEAEHQNDGSGPKDTGRGLSPSITELGPSNILCKMLRFSGPFPKVELGPTPGLRYS